MKINWKVRIKNKMFWLTIIPAVFVLVGKILAVFGIVVDFDAFVAQLLDIVEAVFMILAILGIVTDMTTDGVKDSELAMSYEEPKKD